MSHVSRRTSHPIARLWFVLFIAASILLLASPRASANPVIVPVEEVCLVGVFLLFLNLPVNLVMYSLLLLLMGYVWEKDVGGVPANTRKFIKRVIGIAAIVTPVGAVVDYVVVMQLDYDSVSGGDILALTVALLLIWVSYYVSSAVLLDLSPRPNVLIASAAIAFNALFWTIMLNVEHGTEDILRFLVPAMFLAASPIVMLALSKWHRSRIAEREIV